MKPDNTKRHYIHMDKTTQLILILRSNEQITHDAFASQSTSCQQPLLYRLVPTCTGISTPVIQAGAVRKTVYNTTCSSILTGIICTW